MANATVALPVPTDASLRADLPAAIDRGDLRLWFQPIFSINDNAAVGVEGLARWPHPQAGMIGPDRFLPMLTDPDVYRRFSRSMLRQAAAFARRCNEKAVPSWVSVNLDARNFQDHNLPRQLERLLDNEGLRPEILKIEVTERDIVGDNRDELRVLHAIAELGVALSIDDFGTGHSSLEQLRRIPAAEVKIDRCFVQDMVSRTEDQVLVRAIVNLARSLHLSVVAEGVETPQQLELLRGARCDLAQGYLLAQPLSAEQALQFMGDHALDNHRITDESDAGASWVSSGSFVVDSLAEHLDDALAEVGTAGFPWNMLEVLPTAVFLKGRDGRLVWSNRSHRIRLGVDEFGDIANRTDLQLHKHDEALAYRADDLRVLATGQPLVDRHEIQTRSDGTTIRLRTTKLPIRNAGGDVIGLAGFYSEVGDGRDRWLDRDVLNADAPLSPSRR